MALYQTWILGALLLTTSLTAQGEVDKKYLTIGSMEVREVRVDDFNQEISDLRYSKSFNDLNYDDSDLWKPDPIDQAEKVVKVARDIIALGEDIYNLVIKGKPNITTKYDPISVIPRVNKEAVDTLGEMDSWALQPVTKSYDVAYKNLYGMEVVKFRYTVMFGYGGKYNGKGAYITGAQIFPRYVNVMFGFDFTATMKVAGIQNSGTRDNPLAVAILLMEYTVSNIAQARTETASISITGKGAVRKF